ncbi:MAG: hydroxyacylglutathione hydrolase [Rhodocyclaceae bacterium]|nr:hydroxyacylglutathione hydrolase [Rhodocyclaceae bacterium]
MEIIPLPAFSDNYLWLIHDGRHAVVVDPGDDGPVARALAGHGLELTAILLTHHHADHTGGVAALARAGLPVYGPAAEHIAGVTHPLADGDRVAIDAPSLALQVIAVPGHTRGHIAYFGDGMLLCGDTLFNGGCGRLFEGTAAQMHASLGRLAALPGDTRVYCAHEYTLANLEFARAAEPHNPERDAYRERCRALRDAGRPTLPTDIATQRAVNPFLRCDSRSVRDTLALADAPDVQVFAGLRAWKDRF